MERYRIELVRIGDEKDETLVALEGSAELVGRMAGGLVAEAVGAERAATTVVMPSDRPADVGDDDGKPKRTRRTKAQIAADEAAARIAEQRVADGAPVTQQLDAPAESAPVASSGPVPAAAPATPAAPVSAAPGVPYDPFAAK